MDLHISSSVLGKKLTYENNSKQQWVLTTWKNSSDVTVDSAQGNHGDWNIRRFRLGGKAKMFNDFTVHAEVDINPQEAPPAYQSPPTYQRLTDAYVAWSRSKSFVATVGKQSVPFTMDGSTSSKELLAIDRGNLANNYWFPYEYIPGISVSGRPDQWIYSLGAFTSGSATKEFGNFDGGYMMLATVGYDFGKQLGVKEAVLAVNYVYNEPDEDNSFTRNLQHVGSINFKLDAGKWGVRTDLTAAAGYLGQSDAWGAMVMPFYNITKKLQVVARYTYLSSRDNNGLRLALYENAIVSGRGDEYNEGYVGLNYYFYGHKLKLQSGLQYADMKDQANDGGRYHGWSWVTGLRIGW